MPWPPLLLAYFLLTLCQFSFQTSIDDDLTITLKQKETLDRFKERVKSIVPFDYMKKDIYLIRWLRARNFNVAAAEEMLIDNLKWRSQNKMETILQEDWEDFDRVFPFAIEGCDKEGRPVISVPVGEWDVRQAVIAGHSRRLMRYYDKLFEEISVYIRTSQGKGENITQYDFLMEMSGYNLILQGCPLCIPVYVYFFQSYENHFPGSFHKSTLVNVPQIFLALWEILSPLLSARTRASISMYGKDKAQWKPVLAKSIDKTQLTKEFGGLKDEPYSVDDLRNIDKGHFQCHKYAWKKSSG